MGPTAIAAYAQSKDDDNPLRLRKHILDLVRDECHTNHSWATVGAYEWMFSVGSGERTGGEYDIVFIQAQPERRRATFVGLRCLRLFGSLVVEFQFT